ncbi:hypothetical protein AB0E75_05045 [Streptomyces griseoviridis]|jgi:hypothetical protein|uniref:Uncharacterized protein n=3 Tax=Streptomyces TaxID=1883 RepID=A0ABT9LR08_STRGD|nr:MULTISPECIES: hypothetical protein [Streptomyces]MDP9685984.1 hypothetical protein [Streptomyces griseoviridis]GGS64641.1 hypothetical protein GCM10010238_62090 [Streptomyces niveoruber]GGS78566.1 hypothetical protein GCM10010240_09720 [Streptomyces griseoviridis]GGU15980.1 hypothetical protein GCM10010259_02910 [Streptomyces daghestanicus]GHI35272.1 hypothetical protein Sdagh_70020 [Streptomyces daghestanicus]
MYKSSCAFAAALAVALVWPAGTADATPRAAAADRPVHAPAGVGASECVAGGGMIIVSWEGEGEAFSQYCHGGLHDGETVV